MAVYKTPSEMFERRAKRQAEEAAEDEARSERYHILGNEEKAIYFKKKQ